MPKRRVLAAYVPVLHQGYLRFFDADPAVTDAYVFDTDILSQLDYIRKDLRALTPQQQVELLQALGRFSAVRLLTARTVSQLDRPDTTLIMPDEDVSRAVAGLLEKASVVLYPVFLRWDRRAVDRRAAVSPDRTISSDEFDHEIMRQANAESRRSSNIWRRVGAVIVKDGKVLMKASNRHLPTDHSLWMDGDPRSTLHQGVGIETTTDMHAEAKLIAAAAHEGIALKGADIYCTNFPCPPCAKLIAESGILKCYYSGGYAVLDGEAVLKGYGIEIIHVNEPEDDGHPGEWVAYRKP